MDDTVLPDGAASALRALLTSWREHRRDGRLPCPAQMQIDAVFADAPGAAMIEVVPSPGGAVYRFVRVGEAFNAALRRDVTNRALEEILPRAVVAGVRATYDRIVADRTPHYWVRTLARGDALLHRYERLLVPLARDGETVNALLGVWQWVERTDSQRRREDVPLAFSV